MCAPGRQQDIRKGVPEPARDPDGAILWHVHLVYRGNARLKSLSYPLVLKADGLCAGKGVLVAKSYGEAADFADRVLEKKEFGGGAAKPLIEEALEGDEFSFIVLSDGDYFVPLAATRDHKRAFDGIEAQIPAAWAPTPATASFPERSRSKF